MKNISRRSFVKYSTLASISIAFGSEAYSAVLKENPIQFGLIADIHKDIMHDADSRLDKFIKEVEKINPDFIMQLGDFCIPKHENKEFLSIWNTYKGPKYHVIGNHDTDGGYSREQVVQFWKMPAKYYSFDKKGLHVIVLDGNDKNPKPWSGYNRYIGNEQKEWLINDLKNTNKPTIVFSHQTLELESDGVVNMKEIRAILEESNKEAGFQKVLCCLSGHTHTDFATQINGIHYVQINSASYRWVGGNYKTIRYSEEVDAKYKWIKYTIPYKDPLFTFVKITNNKIVIESCISEFVGPGPDELKMPKAQPNDPIAAKISGFKLKLK